MKYQKYQKYQNMLILSWSTNIVDNNYTDTVIENNYFVEKAALTFGYPSPYVDQY